MHLRIPALCVALAFLASAGCGYGPKTLTATRLPYNEAVKVTTEEQLLLNIVRLRYSDNMSSLAVTTVAAQFELVRRLQLTPFFTSAAAGQAFGGYRGSILPGGELDYNDRPTLSYTPQDESEFARRLFTPISLEGIIYLAKTTWQISTVFRLYLENLNWVSNAQTISGPTPKEPPEFEAFLRGIRALQRLQDENKVAILLEERDDRVGGVAEQVTARDMVEAAKASYEFKRDADVDDGKSGEKKGTGWALVKKKDVPYLFIAPDEAAAPDWLEFCRTFKVKPGEKKYEIEVTKLTPFPATYPAEGVKVIDLETRSLLQVLFFVSHGVEVPPEHLSAGLAQRVTQEADGTVFDYHRVLGDLFTVKTACGRKRPADAAVAVRYLDRWYYIEQGDHDSRATFALLMQLSHLEVGTKPGAAPVLTLPIGGR